MRLTVTDNMHILMTGAAGMIGRKLTARLIADKALNDRPIERLTLLDVSAPRTAGEFFRSRQNHWRPTLPIRRPRRAPRLQAGLT